MNKTYTFLDGEWANKNFGICQLGLVYTDTIIGKAKKYEEIYKDINPESPFDPNCVKIHHITQYMVKECPNFKAFWETYNKYFLDTILIGYDIKNNDIKALVTNLLKYNIDIPEFTYIDVYQIAKDNIPRKVAQRYNLNHLSNSAEEYSNFYKW